MTDNFMINGDCRIRTPNMKVYIWNSLRQTFVERVSQQLESPQVIKKVVATPNVKDEDSDSSIEYLESSVSAL